MTPYHLLDPIYINKNKQSIHKMIIKSFYLGFFILFLSIFCCFYLKKYLCDIYVVDYAFIYFWIQLVFLLNTSRIAKTKIFKNKGAFLISQ